MTTPRPPRESATVILVRTGVSGLETYMVRRHLNSDFIGGAYVFPGGTLDEADQATSVLARCEGLLAAKAGQALQLPPERAVGHWGCAIRETFEEAGLLLARRGGLPIAMDTEAERSRWAERRRQLNNREIGWEGLLAAEDLALACDRVHYFAHWVTPEGVPKRFTTRFFVALAPDHQDPLVDDREVDAGEWIAPAKALARQARGEFTMIFPTIKTLEELAQFAGPDELIAACQDRQVTTQLPRVVERAGRPVVLLPGEAGYEEAADHPPVTFDPSRP